jgi:hypothetical protein
MWRRLVGFVLVMLVGGQAQGLRAADAFDLYTNPVLAEALKGDAVKEHKALSPDDLVDHDRVLKGVSGAFLIVKTNQGRNCKLLVQAARQKIDDEKSIPMLLVDRYVTYKEGDERTVLVQGKNLALFAGFRLNLDLGQIVPEELGGDIRLVAEGEKVTIQPIGQARLFLLTKAVEDLKPPTGTRVVVGEAFEPSYFNGTYQLHDDGRRSGKLTLQVQPDNTVTGDYFSDRDGRKYPVTGKLGSPLHSIQFDVKFPQTVQKFQGWLFTGDARVIAGSATMAGREAGFYAVRVED